jgi:hypothetical protein
VQHLRERRPHPGALTGGEYDDGNRSVVGHAITPMPVRRAAKSSLSLCR